MSSTNASALPAIAGTSRRATQMLAATAGLLLGLGVLWTVGFASPSVIHNAVHDARHANGFPCH